MRKIFIVCILVLSTSRLFSQGNTFPATGSVGIGTVSPYSKLHINAGPNSSGLLLEGSDLFALKFKTYTAAINTTTHRISQVFNYNDNDLNGFIDFIRGEDQSGGSIALGTNELARLTVASNGNVGIGIANPATKLHVEGGLFTSGTHAIGHYHNDQGYNGSGVLLDGNFDPIWIKRYNYSTDQSALRVNIGDDGGDDFSIGYTSWENGQWVPSVKINAAGTMTVGTNTLPSGYRLAVGGGIIAEKVKVQMQSGWPDYVFSPNYQLLPLQEVEQFIQQNKHLPDIPSAKKIAADGIEVGDTQALLLKKIEELTLYMIQQDKLIKEQSVQMTAMKDELKS